MLKKNLIIKFPKQVAGIVTNISFYGAAIDKVTAV